MIIALALAGAINLTPYQIIESDRRVISYKHTHGRGGFVCYLPSCNTHYRIRVIARCKSNTRNEGFVAGMGNEQGGRRISFAAISVMEWAALDSMFREMDRYFSESCEWTA